MDIEEALAQLIMRWVSHRPFGSVFDATLMDLPAPEIPQSLLHTITNKEPYRSQVITDAELFLSIPVLFGIGMNIEILTPVDVVPFYDWQQTIRPLQANIRWSLTMSGDNSEYHSIQMDRVVFEDDQWKIASIWNDKEREQTVKDSATIKDIINKKTAK